MFQRLQINSWRQFEAIDISFHPRLTILTGENGAGKTTILNLLNPHFGWAFAFLGTPLRDRKGVLRYLIDRRRAISC